MYNVLKHRLEVKYDTSAHPCADEFFELALQQADDESEPYIEAEYEAIVSVLRDREVVRGSL